MEKVKIIGVMVNDRMKDATLLQEILTKYGCNIKTRVGLHDVGNSQCNIKGLLILEVVGTEEECKNFEADLSKISDITVQKMIFDL